MLIWTTLLSVTALALSPAPKEMTVDLDDRFFFRADTLVVLPDAFVAERTELLAPISELLDGRLRTLAASDLNRVDPALYIATATNPGALEKRRLRRFRPDEDMRPSGYELSVSDYGVVLVGADEAGVWYGLHTLAALAAEYGNNLPYLTIRDWPALTFRGAYLRSMPTESELIRLASLRATHVFVESDDLYNISGIRAEAWAESFDRARELRIEPIPVFSTLDGMEKVLRDYPMLIEGRAVSDAVRLRGVTPAALRYPNIIAEGPEDIQVRVSGVPCVFGRDYWMEGPPIQAPFHDDGARWRLWRELESVIPDGGTVDVSYSYATADSSSLSFSEPRTKPWLEERLAWLINALQPRHIHLDHGSIGRLNTDTRSIRDGLDRPERFVQSVNMLAGIIAEIDDGVTPMMWADLINPRQGATVYGLGDVTAELPSKVQTLGRVTVESPGSASGALEALRGFMGRPEIVGVDGAGAAAAYVVQALEGSGGIVALHETGREMEAALDAAWSGAGSGGLWPRALNGYFDTLLEQPGYGDIQSALVTYVNTQTLDGVAPREVFERFDGFIDRNEALLSDDPDGLARVKQVLDQLTTYLDLENRYTESGDVGVLRKLQSLVEAIQASDPEADAARYQRILETIDSQGLFVPATILFQEELRYYRPWPNGRSLYPVPVLPEFSDAQGAVTATIPFMNGQAAVRRIDFEGLGIASLSARFSVDGMSYQDGPRWDAPEALGQLRGPVRFADTKAAYTLELNATGSRSPLVFRDVRFFAEKERTELSAHYAAVAPAMVPSFIGSSWAKAFQGGGFMNTAEQQFAEAPTAVWVTHTRDALYVGIRASETRPEAIVADLTGRDQPLWTQESVEIWLQPEGRLPLRLVVSPEGMQYDSEVFDGGWDGNWEVVADRMSDGWAAVVRIPVELTGRLRRGDSLPVNFVRNRYGARKERSAWAQEYGVQSVLQWGAVRFP